MRDVVGIHLHNIPLFEEVPMQNPEKIRAPEFPGGLEWVNTAVPLTLQELRGKIVLLEFWTFC
jgi:hypothetical protein